MFVFSNLATSIDGKIATATREHFPLGTPADRRLMKKLRTRADAVVVGASTLRAFKRPIVSSGATGKHPLNVVVSSRLDGISPRWPFFTDPRTHKVLFVSQAASERKIHALKKAMGSSGRIFRLRQSGGAARQIIRQLETLGVRRLLVEGGGGLMWDFIEPNLIDEIYLTLTPRIVGGTDAPTLVDGRGFPASKVLDYKIKSCRRLGNELYLVYSRRG